MNTELLSVLKEKDQMLVKVKVGFFRGKKTSHLLRDEAAKKHGADADRILVRLSLMNPKDGGELLRVAKTARRIIRNNTMPYDGVWRRTTTAIYPKIAKEMAKLEREAKDVALDIAKRWPAIKKEAMRKLPGLVTDDDFPADGDEFLERFSFSFSVDKVTDPDDIKFNLPADELEKLRERVRAEEAEKLAEGRRWLADWATDLVKSVAPSIKSGAIRKGTQKRLSECAKFIEDNSVGQVPACVKKLRELAAKMVESEEPKETKQMSKEVDTVLDELANFGK